MSNKEGLAVWLKRIRNFIPKPSTVMRAISIQTSRWMTKLRRLIQSFSPYLPKVPFSSSMSGYPGTDTPLVVKIEAYKNRRHFHGAAQYGDVFVESDGDVNTTDQENFIKPIVEGKTSPLFFIMSPEKLGLDASKLKKAMQTEAAKIGDYDYYADNCIDHVIRPLKKAGAHIDFGCISTPKELAQWCDQQCQQGNGILVDLETYKRILATQKRKGTRTSKKGKIVDKNNQILNKLLTQASSYSKKNERPVRSVPHSWFDKIKNNHLFGGKKTR